MNRNDLLSLIVLLSLLTFGVIGVILAATAEPDGDRRATTLMDADHFEARIPPVQSRAQWEERKQELREMVLNSAGLWPEPERNPLNAKIFDERQGDGFRVAKVHFESLPGYLATGNLYRPAAGDGPFPAIVSPHGHWRYGRLTNTESGSIPGRCIDLARMGFVVFSIDMVGYNDSLQLPHDPGKSRAQLKADAPLPYDQRVFQADFDFPEAALYGFSLGGIQLWNAVRAVDFLSGLPEVDPERIGATGASGGATQTLLLMAVDDRIQAAAPVNIIGARKHPGCRCENFPGLWRDTTTIEVAATFAPKPLLLPSATEDPWTNSFPEQELPIFKKYYALYGAEENVHNVHIDAGHNYNAETRAAVYEWFARHLKSSGQAIKNPISVTPEMKQLGDLRVFPDKVLPESALSGFQVMRNWMEASEKAFQSSLPGSSAELSRFASTFGKRLGQVLGAELDPQVTSRSVGSSQEGNARYERLLLGRGGKGDAFHVEIVSGANPSKGTLVVVQPEELGGLLRPEGGLREFTTALMDSGYRIVRVGGYASGELSISRERWESFSWPDVYNRDNRLNGVQDIVTALSYVKGAWSGDPVTLVGLGRCGILTAFAGAVHGGADRVVVDLAGRDPGLDSEMVEIFPVGSIRRVGDFRTAAVLLMENGLTILNPAESLDREWYQQRAADLGFSSNFQVKERQVIWPPSAVVQ